MNYMKGKIFIDTNVLIYSQNTKEAEKQSICRKVLSNIADNSLIVISTQVMQEYYNVATLKMGIEKLLAKRTVQMFDVYEIVTIQPSIIFKAMDIHVLNQLSFWDSLIISAAKSANCMMLLTEDMNDGQVIEGVKIQSPFTFQME